MTVHIYVPSRLSILTGVHRKHSHLELFSHCLAHNNVFNDNPNLYLNRFNSFISAYYTYENFDDVVPNFNDFKLDLTEFSGISLPELNLTLPEINITLPSIRDKIPDLPKAYYEYKDIVHNRMSDATDYMKVVANSCYEEMRRFWHNVAG